MNTNDVDYQIHKLLQQNDKPAIIYLMGRIASGKGHVLEALKHELPRARVVSVSSIVSELSGARDRKSLQGTSNLSRSIATRIGSMLSLCDITREVVIVDGIRQPQILLPLMHFYGGLPLWVDATPTVREIRYHMRGAERDQGIPFADADASDTNLGIDALYACLQIMPETYTVYNPFTIDEIVAYNAMYAKPDEPEVQAVQHDVIEPTVEPTVDAELRFHVCTTPTVQLTPTRLEDLSKSKVVLNRPRKPDTFLTIYSNSPGRLVNSITGAAVTTRAIEKNESTTIAILTDVDGRKLYSAAGNLGVSLKQYLLGPNFTRRVEESDVTIPPHSFATCTYRTAAIPTNQNHLICVHAEGVRKTITAITYYDVSECAVVTKPLVQFDKNAPLSFAQRLLVSGVQCDVPAIFGSWHS